MDECEDGLYDELAGDGNTSAYAECVYGFRNGFVAQQGGCHLRYGLNTI